MQARGTIKGISRDFESGRLVLTVELTEGEAAAADALRGKDLSIEMKQYRNPRSASANALLWTCLQRIADALGGDKWDYYIDALRKYGRYTMLAIRADAAKRFCETYRECEEIGRKVDADGVEWVHMLCYFGSSTYDSREFSILLDGVIEDMKQAGIEAPTSAEMRRVLAALERSERKEGHDGETT